MRWLFMMLCVAIVSSCADNERAGQEKILGEYMYLELNKGAICHMDKMCGHHTTYIKTDLVISKVRDFRSRRDYKRDENSSLAIIGGNYHFCGKCVPLKIMKDIDSLTSPVPKE